MVYSLSNLKPSSEADLHGIMDILATMIEKEHQCSFNLTIVDPPSCIQTDDKDCTTPTSNAKVSSSSPMSPSTVIDEPAPEAQSLNTLSSTIRREVCQWMYRVVDYYNLDRRIVAIGMNLFMRYISLCLKDEMASLELITATSLYLAVKLNGPRLNRHDNLLQNFVRMSSSRFNEEDMVQMEMTMLTKLSWKVNPVTPQDCIPYIVSVSNYSDLNDQVEQTRVIDLANYFSELVIFNPTFGETSPSSLACAAAILALDNVNAARNNNINAIDMLYHLFYNKVFDYDAIKIITEDMSSYLREISPTVDNSQLDIDPTGALFNYTIASP